MSKANADIQYDPDFPYVVVWGKYVAARFPADEDGRANAITYAKESVGSMIDTTPKPKIPEDAEFIYYYKSGYDFYVRQLENGDWKTDGGVLYTYPEILEVVEDAEVTVLVRKDAT